MPSSGRTRPGSSSPISLGSKYADHVAVVQQLHDAGVDIHITNDRTTSSVEENLIAVKQAYTEANARFADYPLSSDDPDH